MKIISYELRILLSIITIIVVTIISYSHGLLGGFLLDDIPNLQNLNVFSRFQGLDAFIRYIFSYDSGILKRPVTTLSFLLNSTTLTFNAFNFKVTNLAIHIINGILLYIVTKNILKTLNFNHKEIQYIAISNMALWILHPFFVSTTLYVVQRMAMLPVTFSLIGIIFYLKGRNQLNIRLQTIYIFIACYVCTIFAVLSKENGVILPCLILLLEYIVLKKSKLLPLTKSQKFLIMLPPIIIILALTYKVPSFLQGYEYRSFTIFERLMTETRVIMDYIGHLFFPRVNSLGVYSDGFKISSSLTSPITTLTSIFAIISLILFAFLLRKKMPLICFSLSFYFISHIIESTIIPLELYFEHRNYLPGLFIFLPIPILLIKYFKKYYVHILLTTLISVYLANTTYKKSLLWGDTTNLMLDAVNNNPLSIRAIEKKAVYHYQNKNPHLAIELLNNSIKKHSNTSLRVNLLNLKCYKNNATQSDFTNLNKYIIKNKYTAHDAASIAGLLFFLTFEDCLSNNYQLARDFINTVKNQSEIKIPKVHKAILSAEIFLNLESNRLNDIDVKIINYLNQYHDFQDVIKMINKLITINQMNYAHSVIHSTKAELLLNKYKFTDRDYLKAIDLISGKFK